MAITEQDRAKAFELFGQGMSTNEVAKQLFKGYWTKANNLRKEWDARDGGASEEAAAEPEAWDLTLNVSADRLDRIFAGFTEAEKASAISGVLQARLEAA